MQSLGKFPDRFLAEIAGQPEALRRADGAMGDQGETLEWIAAAGARADAIVFTGMGSSYDACYAPVTCLNGAGVATSMVDAAELLHFRLGSLTGSSLLVCVSQSGESAELVRLTAELAARGERPLIVSVTNGLDNTTARAADLSLDTRAGAEEGPSTMTFAGTLVALAAVAGALGAPDSAAAGDAADAVERLLEGAERRAAVLERWLGDRGTLALLARGASRPAAEMGALTLKEAARFPAESLQTAQFRHGPLELAGPDLAAIVMACEQSTLDLDLGLAAELTAAGSAVLVISSDGRAPVGAEGIGIGGLARGLVSAAAIVPVQLLAWRLANLRGLDPGSYSVASKVTTRE